MVTAQKAIGHGAASRWRMTILRSCTTLFQWERRLRSSPRMSRPMPPEIKPFKIRDVEINPPSVKGPTAAVEAAWWCRFVRFRVHLGGRADAKQSEIETADAFLRGRATLRGADLWRPAGTHVHGGGDG